MDSPYSETIPIPPPPPRLFVGRKQLIEEIIAEITSIDGPAPRIAIQGMGGIGKTALVTQIAEYIKSNFPGGIFWGNELPSNDRNPSIILKDWGEQCGQSLEKVDENNLPSRVRSFLTARRKQLGPILAIVDDVRMDWIGGGIKAIEQSLPLGTPLIITTRQTRPTQDIDAKVYNLDVLSRSESCQLLISLSKNKISASQAEAFSELCGDMPLALELMAKLTKTKKSDSLLDRLQSEANRLDIIKLDEASRKEQSVQISMDVSYQELAERHFQTARLFRYFSVYAQPVFIVQRHLVNSLAQFGFSVESYRESIQTRSGGASNAQKSSDDYEDAVFVSYAWGGESEKIVDDLERAFAERGIRIMRDKKDIDYKDSIKEFEERLAGGQCIILVVSDKYLRSKSCMFELVKIAEKKEFADRIFPVILPDARIYDASGRIDYIKYWHDEKAKLNEKVMSLPDQSNLKGIHDELDNYDRFRDEIDGLTNTLKDMNALTPEMHAASGFATLINSVEKVFPERLTIPQPDNITSMSLDQRISTIEDNFSRLVDRSLLMEDRDIENSEMEYYRIHALLYEYIQPLTIDKAELESAIQNHIQYCVAFAKANLGIDLQKRQKSTFEFERSYVQLLLALARIKERYMPGMENWEDHLELAGQIMALVEALDNHWQLHSQFGSQIEWLQLAYKCAGALGNANKRADFARRLGRVFSLQGKLDEALEWMKHSEEALDDDRSEEANAIRALMFIHRAAIIYQRGETENAERDCLLGLELVDLNKQPKVYAEGYNLLGVIKMRINKLSSALEALEKSLSTWNQIGDQYQINRVKDNRRNVLFYLGRITELRKEEDEGVKYWEQFPDIIELSIALTNRGLVYHIDGEYESAINLHKRAMEISDTLAVPRMQAMIRTNIAGPYISLEKYDEAEGFLNKSLEIQTEYDTKEYWVDTQRSLAELAFGRKLYPQAVELAENALELAKEDEDPLEEGAALRTLGQALHLNGNLEQARKCLEEGLVLLMNNEFNYEGYLTLLALAKLYVTQGETAKALATEDEIQSLAKEMGLR